MTRGSSRGPSVTVRVDRLRVSGASGAEAIALASALREALGARLRAGADAFAAQASDAADTEHLRVTVPRVPGHGSAAVGAAAGARIADALVPGKGRR